MKNEEFFFGLLSLLFCSPVILNEVKNFPLRTGDVSLTLNMTEKSSSA